MANNPTRADLAAEAESMGIRVRKSWTATQIQQAIANESCGGCDNDDHCGACECCAAEATEGDADETPAEQPAPAKGARTKNATVEVDGYTVKIGSTCLVHDAEGKRIAIVKKSAVPVLTQAVAEKVMRVQTAYLVDEDSIGWVRNGVSLAAVARIIKKAEKQAAAK